MSSPFAHPRWTFTQGLRPGTQEEDNTLAEFTAEEVVN